MALIGIKIVNNNETKFILIKTSKSLNYKRNINVINYYIHRYVKKGKLVIIYISSSDIFANGLKKPFFTQLFKKNYRKWEIIK